MFRKFLFFIAICLYATTSLAETKNLSVSFDKGQFSYSYDSIGALTITPLDQNLVVTYASKDNEPSLPLVALTIKVPKGKTFYNFSYTTREELVFNNATIAYNPTILTDTPTPVSHTIGQYTLPKYTKKIYPSSQVEYIMTTNMGDSTVFHFCIKPFKYDATNKRLYLENKINIDININDNDKITETEQRDSFINFCKKNNLYFNKTSIHSFDKGYSDVVSDSIDYIIITSQNLSPAFQHLVQWKRTKGIRAFVETIENIKKTQTSSTLSLPDKIKAYLMHLYYEKGYKFKYLLLGGDETIVPSKKCHGEIPDINYKRDDIPTDMYYACLDDYEINPFWGLSTNGIYGGTENYINFSQTIYVTRLPVRTKEDVANITAKIIGYEKSPSTNGWNNSILMAGSKIDCTDSLGQSDSSIQCGLIYKNTIKPSNWRGSISLLFDTYSSFKQEGMTDINSNSLHKALSMGFTFMEMMCHGSNLEWTFFNDSYYYRNTFQLVNNHYTIINTTACFTNAFDWNVDPCLSECFIRNANNGIIAYLGSSREGFSYRGERNLTKLGPSSQFDNAFYRTLFSPITTNKHYGEIVANAKHSLLSFCNDYGPIRCLLFSLNPLGDPEMQVYTVTPQKISSQFYTFDDKLVTLNVNTKNCTICIMSQDDYGESYYKVFKDSNYVEIKPIEHNLSVCINKQNYIPKIYTIPSIKNSNNNNKIKKASL